jgi:hypothetical protein
VATMAYLSLCAAILALPQPVHNRLQLVHWHDLQVEQCRPVGCHGEGHTVIASGAQLIVARVRECFEVRWPYA